MMTFYKKKYSEKSTKREQKKNIETQNEKIYRK